MLEDAKIDGFLVRPNTPRDCMLGFDIDPADKVRLEGRKLAVIKGSYSNDFLTLLCISSCSIPAMVASLTIKDSEPDVKGRH